MPFLFTLGHHAATLILGLLLLTWFTNPAWSGTEDDFETQRAAMIALEDAFAVLATADIDSDLEQILPPAFFQVVTAAACAARSSGTVEDKVHMLVNDLGLDCSQLLTYTLIAIVVDIVNIIPYDHVIAEILAAATLLCYLGVL